jgi:hypothetical protein
MRRFSCGRWKILIGRCFCSRWKTLAMKLYVDYVLLSLLPVGKKAANE